MSEKSKGTLEVNRRFVCILAALFHCATSNTKKYHTYCPEGEDSWCRFQADKAQGTTSYKPGLALLLKIVPKLKPMFPRLSNDALLKKCLHGKTQNQNESFNRTIWDRIPKAGYVGKETFKVGIYDAVANFNMGTAATIEVLKQCGIKPGRVTEEHCSDIDQSRPYSSEYRENWLENQARKKLRSKKESKSDNQQEKEGTTYAQGEF